MQHNDGAAATYGALAVLMAFHIFFGGIVVERMTEVYFGLHSALFNYRSASLIALTIAVIYAMLATKPKLPFLAWILIAMTLVGLTVGVYFGRPAGVMASHAVQAATALLGFLAGYLFLLRRYDLWNVVRITSYAAVFSVAIWLVVYVVIATNVRHGLPDFSLNFYVLIIPFAYFLIKGQGLFATLTFVLMILVGKRAIMLAGVAMLAWYWILSLVARERGFIATRYCVAILALFSIRTCWPLFSVLTHAPRTKATDIGRSVAVTDINTLSSYRGDLIASVASMLQESPIQWLTGAGFGSNFVFSSGKTSATTFGVDLMPLHLVMLYGLPLSIIVFVYLAIVQVKSAFAKSPAQDRMRDLLSILLVGYLSCSMFSYVSIDPTMWFFIGAATLKMLAEDQPGSPETVNQSS